MFLIRVFFNIDFVLCFQDLPSAGKGVVSEDDIISAIPRPAGEQDEDLSEYKFQKYAATYFQGNVNHQYSRKQLKQPLLQLQTQGDQLVSTETLSFANTNCV